MFPRSRTVLAVAVYASVINGVAGFIGGAAPLKLTRQRHQSAVTMVTTERQQELEKLKFLSPETAKGVRQLCGTPAYVYDLRTLKESARACLSFPAAYGLTVRYAMKALPNAAVLQLFNSMGIKIDASSGWEARRAMAAGVPASDICISSQELPLDFAELHSAGVWINACSLSQLESFGRAFEGGEVGVRFNPGLGSGGTGKTNVGGKGASFGIWHEQLPHVREIAAKYGLGVTKVHTHIGSGSDPAVWQKVAGMSLDLVRQLPDVTRLDLGGGYKVARMSYEAGTDMQVIGAPVAQAFERFAAETGRKLHLEIEPGTFLVATAGAMVTTVQDKVSTGPGGHTFLKLDAGMTDLLRPSLYGAQHPIIVLSGTRPGATGASPGTESCVVVGHCCESGDLLTPAPGSRDDISERTMAVAEIGDLCVVEGCGAYVSAMSAKNYNSFPEAAEVLLDERGGLHLLRKRQRPEQVFENEVPVPSGLF